MQKGQQYIERRPEHTKRETLHARINKAEREALYQIAQAEQCSSMSEAVRVLIRERAKELGVWLTGFV